MPDLIRSRRRRALPVVAALLIPALASADAIQARIDASKPGPAIQPHVYGQFLEHIADIVNDGLWAEMLTDRKFYYAVSAEPPPPPAPPWRRRAPRRFWAPVGPADAISMDAESPYVGEHGPRVELASEPRGIEQTGLVVRKDRSYTGRVVLAGPEGTSASVSLIWGEAEGDRHTITIQGVGAEYATFPLSFDVAADSDAATLRITAKGTDALHIGAVSLMPADNVEGFRAEVISELARVKAGVYRFPGGNFVSGHEWRNAVGDPDKRPPIMDPVWDAVQPNDVGTDEFLTLCRLLDADAYITANAGFGDAFSAAQLVEYVNGDASTPMGAWRAANGHREPYGVTLWGIGNEPWGDWQLGFMPVAQFALKHDLFAKAMLDVDSTIKLIAGGATPDTMAGSKQSQRINGQIVPEYLSPADWSGSLLKHSLENIDYLSEHFYSTSNQKLDLEKGEKVEIEFPLVEWMRQPATQVRVKVEHYREYEKLIPGLKEKPVPISLDEWAYIGSPRDGYKVVPAYAWVFHEMFRHSDIYQIGGFTFGTSLVSANRTDAVLNPTGLLFALYSNHYGSIPVEVSGDSPQPKPEYPVGGDQPAVNPGSPTYPLDVVAALSADGSALTVGVVNPSDAEQQLVLEIGGVTLAGGATLRRMAPDSLDAAVAVGEEPGVEVEETSLDALPGALTIAPFSVGIYELPLSR